MSDRQRYALALIVLALVAFNVHVNGGLPGVAPSAGPRTVLIVYETEEVTPSFSRLLNGLRTGEHAKYLADHKHVLHEIDDDASSVEGGKSPLLEKYAESVKYPRSLIIADTATGKVVAVGELTDASTAAGVIKVLKDNGG